jgi:hypothetical protein
LRRTRAIATEPDQSGTQPQIASILALIRGPIGIYDIEIDGPNQAKDAISTPHSLFVRENRARCDKFARGITPESQT